MPRERWSHNRSSLVRVHVEIELQTHPLCCSALLPHLHLEVELALHKGKHVRVDPNHVPNSIMKWKKDRGEGNVSEQISFLNRVSAYRSGRYNESLSNECKADSPISPFDKVRLSFHMYESSKSTELVTGLCLFFRSGKKHPYTNNATSAVSLTANWLDTAHVTTVHWVQSSRQL